ncbi:SMI1/KNR4 family protein [Burkholderia cepacia]|uniref:SMI1/KNR4 family protein n=1 Tax=Burkholderia cepacia TaxID=292 RepID=UPI0039BF0D2F
MPISRTCCRLPSSGQVTTNYCFDYDRTAASREPAVVLWSHETGETTPVSDSFAAFLSMRGAMEGAGNEPDE